MIFDFILVIMTKNLSNQVYFYKTILGLDLIFDNNDAVGLGKVNKIFLVLREDKSKDSHHLSKHKGPQIITFKCQGNINQYLKNIEISGCRVRDKLELPEYGTYLFAEDFDGNEICLDFPFEIKATQINED